MSSGGVKDTTAVLQPGPPARLPGPVGYVKWNWCYPTRDCHTRAATGSSVSCVSEKHIM